MFSVIQLSNHHTTHAKANILLLSAMTISLDCNSCSFSKRSTNFSPSSAYLTIISPSTFSASKKCIGCQLIFINKFEKSTRLLIGLDHKSIICNLVKKSDFFIFILFISNIIYVFNHSDFQTTFLFVFLLLSKISKIFVSLNCFI